MKNGPFTFIFQGFQYPIDFTFFVKNEIKCDALCNLVPFTQLEKCKNHPWNSVAFSKYEGNTPSWVFLTIFVPLALAGMVLIE